MGIACYEDEEAVGVRPDAASRQRSLDRLFVTLQMIKNPGLVGEPGRGPGVAGTEAPPRLDRVERFFVAAVQAQPNAKIKMSDSEVPVELDRAVRMRYRGRTADSRRGTRKTMIVALARKLIIALWRFVTTGEPLDGVVLRPAT